ncbi:hypothetical protein KM043_015656 [Ampulex compressa]|nr:hypothetical protein KM043_015656 [Ampulex compressa]
MAFSSLSFHRGISTSCVCHGKRNFRKFLLYNKRGSYAFKKEQRENPNCDVPIDKRGTRSTGCRVGDKWVEIKEMIPEIIVPSLKDFKLKPYVSYKALNVVQSEFTPKDLFNAVYATKIIDDFKNNQLGPNGEPLNPSENEKLTPQEAKDNARKTGSDMFTQS